MRIWTFLAKLYLDIDTFNSTLTLISVLDKTSEYRWYRWSQDWMSQGCCGRRVRWLCRSVLSSVSRPRRRAKRRGSWDALGLLQQSLDKSSKTNSCKLSTQATARREGLSASQHMTEALTKYSPLQKRYHFKIYFYKK